MKQNEMRRKVMGQTNRTDLTDLGTNWVVVVVTVIRQVSVLSLSLSLSLVIYS